MVNNKSVIIPNEIMFKILELSGNKNMKYIDKSFYKYTLNLRKYFIERLKINPIQIKYKLIKWKQKFHNNLQYRAFICMGEDKSYFIHDNRINIGKLNGKKIDFIKEFQNELIPKSYIKEDTQYYQFAGYVIYWTVQEVYTEDIEMYNTYYLLN
jgi:hypothetical protein